MLVRRSDMIVRPLNGLSVTQTGFRSLPMRKCVSTATADRSLIYGRFGRGCLVAEPAQSSIQPALGTPPQQTSVAIFSADTYVSTTYAMPCKSHVSSGNASEVHALSPGEFPGRGFSRKGN